MFSAESKLSFRFATLYSNCATALYMTDSGVKCLDLSNKTDAKMKIHACLILFVSVCFTTGCGTYASLEHGESSDLIIFGGVRTDAAFIRYQSQQNGWLKKQQFYNPYLDLPFSAVSDVILLPYTISHALVN